MPLQCADFAILTKNALVICHCSVFYCLCFGVGEMLQTFQINGSQGVKSAARFNWEIEF